MRKYIDDVEIRISVLDRILSGALTNADFIQRIAPDLAISGLNGLYNDMCNELADNLCGATYEGKKEIADNYYTDLHPLMTGYSNRLTELADRVRGLGVTEGAVEDIIKVAEAVNDNTIQLGNLDSLIERYYTPKGLPTIRDTDRERQVFERAIKRGYMVRDGNGYKWQKKVAQLGYMIEQLYCPTNTENVPEKAVNRLFGVNRIGSAISQIKIAKTSQKWIETMKRDLFSVED